MQLIHYIGYLFIDDCKHPLNKMMAYLNYIHVAFQPTVFILGFSSLFRKYKVINQRIDILINFVYFYYHRFIISFKTYSNKYK